MKTELKYDNKLLYEIIFIDKEEKSFPQKLFFLFPDECNINVENKIKEEFWKNEKLFKFFNNNKIIIIQYKVFLTENTKCFDIDNHFKTKIFKTNIHTNNEKENNIFENLKTFCIKNLKLKGYINKISLLKIDEKEINIGIDDFSLQELLLVKKLYISNLLKILNSLKESITYDKEFNLYDLKFRSLILAKLRIDKLKMLEERINYLKNNKIKEINNE